MKDARGSEVGRGIPHRGEFLFFSAVVNRVYIKILKACSHRARNCAWCEQALMSSFGEKLVPVSVTKKSLQSRTNPFLSFAQPFTPGGRIDRPKIDLDLEKMTWPPDPVQGVKQQTTTTNQTSTRFFYIFYLAPTLKCRPQCSPCWIAGRALKRNTSVFACKFFRC